VVEIDEIAEAEVAGERCGFGADAFLEIAVRTDAVDVVIDRLERRVAGKARGHHLRRESHSDAVRESLTERAGRHFDAGCVAVFGMTGGARAPLPEIAQLI